MSSTTSESRVWHITGANTGFGLELSLKAIKEGDRVIAAVRNPSKVPDSLKVDGVKILQFDLSYDQDRQNTHAKEAFNLFGRVDVLVNNAAYGYFGAIEETEDAQVKKQFDINVFGVLRTIRAFLPHLRAQGTRDTNPIPSTIMNISSIGGFRSFPTNGIYCSTKFALEGITEALAGEVKPFNIHVVSVEPGYFRTKFLAAVARGEDASSLENLAPKIDAYEGTTAHEARKAFDAYNGRQPGDPVQGAARIWEYVDGTGRFEGKKEKLGRLPLGSDTGNAMRGLADELRRTADYYEDVWRSTDFPEGE